MEDATGKKPETKVISARLPLELIAMLDKLAEEEQRSRGNLLVVIICEYLKERL